MRQDGKRGKNTVVAALALSLAAGAMAFTSGNTGAFHAVAKTQPVTISFWNIYSSGQPQTTYNDLVKEFEKENPSIHVKVVSVNFFDYFTKLDAAMAAGSNLTPDLAMNAGNLIDEQAQAGDQVINLAPLIAKNHLNTNRYFTQALRQGIYGKGIYAVPIDAAPRVLYYNKALFKKAGLNPNDPPSTWAQLETDAKKLTVKGPHGTFKTIGFDPELGNYYFWTAAWTDGGSFFNGGGRPTVNSAKNVQTLQYWVTLQKAIGAKALSSFESETGDSDYAEMATNRLAMYVATSDDMSELAQDYPKFQYGVAPIPGPVDATWIDSWMLEIFQHHSAAVTAASFKLMNFLTSAPAQTQMAQQTGDFPANRFAADAPALISNPVWKVFSSQLKYAHFERYVPGAPTWSTTVDDEVQDALDGYVSPKAALNAAQSQIVHDIKLYNQTHP
jgi:multiple sugar transport system substrate-binding protein